MTQFPNRSTDLMINRLQNQTIVLESEHFQQAVEWSDRLPTEMAQWKTYLNWLMLFGFQTWLHQRAPDLVLEAEHCSIANPAVATLLDAVSNLEIAGFKVCLIRLERGEEKTVTVPRAVVDLPEFIAHFYVLVDVLEEEEEVTIYRVLGYERLTEWQKSHPLRPLADWTYAIPFDWFDPELTPLVVSLRCGDIYRASLPEVPRRSPLPSHGWTALTDRLSHSHPSQQPLWAGLTWEQGATVLTNPDLIQWFYQQALDQEPMQTSTAASPATRALSTIESHPAQPLLSSLINLSQWFQNQVEVGWQAVEALLDPAQLALSMRNRSMATRGKLLDLESKLEEPIALLIGVMPTEPSQANVRVTVCPTVEQTGLPLDLEVMILDEQGVAVMQAQSRGTDMIQLNFGVVLGERFSVKVVLDSLNVMESFVF
jgi:hypothetical protein